MLSVVQVIAETKKLKCVRFSRESCKCSYNLRPNAVPAHLAIGCTLGACGEIDATCNSSAMNKPSNNSQKTGIEVLATDNDVNLYPNPAINEVNLEFSTQIDETFVVEFYDILGKKLEQLPTENFIEEIELFTIFHLLREGIISTESQLVKLRLPNL